MKKSRNLFCILSLIIFVGCKKAPDPGFDVSNTYAVPNEIIKFTNTTTGALSYDWDFGDGSTSKEENPTHVYPVDGTYEVLLRAYSKSGNKGLESTMSSEITIKTPFYEFVASIAGQTIKYTVGSEYSGLSKPIYEGSGSNYSSTYYSTIRKSLTANSFSILKGKINYSGNTSNPYPTNIDFQNYFSPKSYSYSDNAINGIQMIYYDGTGKQWTTNGSQSGSSFAIVEFSFSHANEGQINYVASFNCKLYDASGTSIDLNNGKMTYIFKNYE